jgi:hypothetical protein
MAATQLDPTSVLRLHSPTSIGARPQGSCDQRHRVFTEATPAGHLFADASDTMAR